MRVLIDEPVANDIGACLFVFVHLKKLNHRPFLPIFPFSHGVGPSSAKGLYAPPYLIKYFHVLGSTLCHMLRDWLKCVVLSGKIVNASLIRPANPSTRSEVEVMGWVIKFLLNRVFQRTIFF